MKTYSYSVRNSKFDEITIYQIKALSKQNALDKALSLHQRKRIKIIGEI